MLPLQGSLFLEKQPIWISFQIFWERDPPIFLLESRNCKISGKQQNLPRQQNLSSNEIPTEKSLGLFPEKDAHIGAFPGKGCLGKAAYSLKIS